MTTIAAVMFRPLVCDGHREPSSSEKPIGKLIKPAVSPLLSYSVALHDQLSNREQISSNDITM